MAGKESDIFIAGCYGGTFRAGKHFPECEERIIVLVQPAVNIAQSPRQESRRIIVGEIEGGVLPACKDRCIEDSRVDSLHPFGSGEPVTPAF